ncbi:hypothetical protein ITP53_54805 [Nonomuraea sp. K274]|uniref:Uncharacterized protein n=1 Tax=Nonomuraea cypriaca TaxID=1187855 RepID=A0A931AKI7_9ACTN|nr:hypothetical protein [Nonomuraea cypriaca]MBF8194581.1 hypothetical protein [Nonomuraea cypriaca]
MFTSNDRDPYDWLTIPEILADLDVPEADWREWEAKGQAPIGVRFPDGQVRISVREYERWIDALPSDAGPLTDPGSIRDAIRHALKQAGARGLTYTELCDLFGAIVNHPAISTALDALTQAGDCLAVAGHPETRFRYWGPR